MQTTDDTIHAEMIEEIVFDTFSRNSLSVMADETNYSIDFGERMPTDANGDPIDCVETQSFVDAGVLTRDRGVVLRMTDGSEWNVTISCQRRPDGFEHI